MSHTMKLFYSVRSMVLPAVLLAVAAASGAVAQPSAAAGPVDLPIVAPVMDCTQLALADFSALKDAPLHIALAAPVPDAQPAPYCRVVGSVSPKVNFEVHLPLAGWTQRYLQSGCGGLCGNLNVRVGNADGCIPAQRGELAVASTDMGHRSGEGVWQEDPQARIDFAYRGVHVTALAAKALIEKFYGQKPKYSYFAGCSDGGREALMEAQRFPEDFNGITAGAPAMNFITQNTFYHGWNARVNTGADGAAILTADILPVLHTAAVAACDELDGLKDGLIDDPRACKFDPAATLCKPGQDPGTCLTAAQVDVARKLYQGAHDAKGQQLVISGPQPGSELAWRGVYVPSAPGQGIMSTQISTEVIKYMAFAKNPPAQYTLADFPFDQATFNAIAPMHAIYDSTNPDLAVFSDAGGKLILWHGWSDPHISPLNTIAYYKAMQTLMGEQRVARFTRMYLFPGGYHCGGGDGPFTVDLLSPIMAWVESGSAPNALLASHTAGGPDAAGGRGGRGRRGGPDGRGGRGGPDGFQAAAQEPTGRGSGPVRPTVDRTRPVFPYPQVARYRGNGSIDDAGNFQA
ncbi:MAG: tannase/feruloyl esterase family alpha/beta hydrolase, partial [Candidatus Solibacter sp.]|nr:tannase/feruloyl esterase family alpha/beta hydrolase [Candidatus Solibacter sp.]